MASSTVPRADDEPGWRTRRSAARLAPRRLTSGAATAGASAPINLRGLFEGIRYPRYAFAFAVALIGTLAIRVHELVPASGLLHPAIVLSVLALVLLFPQVSPAAWRQSAGDISFKLTLLYFGWAAAMAPFSYWPTKSVDTVVTLVPPGLVMILAILLLKPDRRTLDRLHVAFVALVIVQVIGTRLLGEMTWTGRLTGFGSFDSNDNASIAAISFPFAVALVVRARGWRRVLGVIGGAMLLVSMGWFNSRGGTLAMGVGVLTLILLQTGRRRAAVLVFAVVAGALFWVTAPEGYRSRIRGMQDLQDDYNLTSYYGRKQVWARARGYVRQHPLSGVGIGAFPVAEGAALADADSRGKWSNTHNSYLQAYSELGVPGGTLFILLLVTGARRGLLLARPPGGRDAAKQARPEYIAGLAAYCTGAYFLSHAYFFILFCLLAMIAYATRVAADGNSEHAKARGAYLDIALSAASRASPQHSR